MNYKPILITILIIITGILYYQLTEPKVETSTILITEVVDGDTIKDSQSNTYRLKGINTPEKSMPFYDEARDFLIAKAENRTVQIESHGMDKYGRILSYIFIKDQNINEEILSEGLGTLYYYGEDNYYEDLEKVEEQARLNQKNIWKQSDDSICLELIELKYKEEPERCSNDEIIKIKNSCDKEIKIILKDDATHIYKETIQPNSVFTKNFSCIWNDDGDSVYVWDGEGLLIFHRY